MLHMMVHINQRQANKFAPLQYGFDTELPRNKYVSRLLRSHYMPQATGQRYGAIAVQLILRAVTRNVSAQYQEVPIYCDNKGVLNHGSQAEKELKETQAQSNVL